MARAGELRHRVEIQQQITQPDAAGGLRAGGDWTTIATVWAAVEEDSGSEESAEGVRVSETKATVRMRDRDDVDETMAILFDGKRYEVRSIVHDPTHRHMMELECVKIEGRD